MNKTKHHPDCDGFRVAHMSRMRMLPWPGRMAVVECDECGNSGPMFDAVYDKFGRAEGHRPACKETWVECDGRCNDWD